jgi:hypothetical protein
MELEIVKLKLNELDAISDGTFVFYDSLPVTGNSVFSDSEYNWSSVNNLRAYTMPVYRSKINWGEITEGTVESTLIKPNLRRKMVQLITPEMVEELKRLTVLLQINPIALGFKRHELNPVTIVDLLKSLIRFVSYILQQRKNIRLLQDIRQVDIKRGLLSYPYKLGRLKLHLKTLCNEFVEKNLKYGQLSFNKGDLENIFHFRKNKGHYEPLPENLPEYLTDKCQEYIYLFLISLGITPLDKLYPQKTNTGFEYLKDNFIKIIRDGYTERKMLTRLYGNKPMSDNSHKFYKKYNVKAEEIFRFLSLVQAAAQTLIFLYTGIRYAEAASIQRGCLEKKHDKWVINYQKEKNVRYSQPICPGEVVAIDLVYDCIVVLEEICSLNYNDFLFSSLETVRVGNKGKPLSNSGLNYKINNFIRVTDTKGEWAGLRVHLHQFKYSHAGRLFEEGVNDIYITMQLNHTFHGYESKPNQVTSQYCDYKKTLSKRILKRKVVSNAEVKIESNSETQGNNTYNIDSGYSFPGAIPRVNELDRYLSILSKSGISPIPTELGRCMYKWDNSDITSLKGLPCLQHSSTLTDKISKYEIFNNFIKLANVRLKRVLSLLSLNIDDISRQHFTQERDFLLGALNDLEKGIYANG